MKLDDYDPTTSQTSTCVDDVFYILKKVLKRSILTYQPEIVAATVKAIIKVTDNRYSQIFQHQMATAFATSDSSRHDRTLEQSKISYMVLEKKKENTVYKIMKNSILNLFNPLYI